MAGKKRERELPPEDALREKAVRKVRSRTGGLWLAYNLGSYVLVNGFLIAIWVLSDSDYPWFLWVMAVWAGGLAFHLAGYVVGFRYGASRERMVQQQVEQYRKKLGIQPPAPEPATAGSRPGEAGPGSAEEEPSGDTAT